MNVTKQSDIKLQITFFDCEGELTPVVDNPFEIKFYTTSMLNCVNCTYDGSTFSTNCKVDPLDENILLCMLDTPNFTPGKLLAKITVYYPDVDFPDNDYKKVKTYTTDIIITE